MRIEERFALAFTTLFHPLLIPTLGIFILFHLNTYIAFSVAPEARRFIILIVFINTAIAPVLSFVIMKRTGYIKDFNLTERSERILPLLVATALFFITYYMLRQLPLPSLVYFYVISATLLLLLTMMVSFFWKISIHMVSLGGFTGFLIITSLLLRADINWLIILALMASGLTGSSRLILKAHSPAQVYAGYLMGLAAMMTLYVYFSN